jgi:protein-S-isoprenylcysteine O-methyltransferase Ste14
LSLDGRNDVLVRAGEWLFRRRTWISLPLALALLLLAPQKVSSSFIVTVGIVLVIAAELVRLWAVHHIGVVSRTRSDRLGPLICTGPFAFVRNPLYLGNIALWAGFAFLARLPWLVPIFVVVLGFEYHAIVRWEEQLLESRRGAEYRAYVQRVPRWMPTLHATVATEVAPQRDSWRQTFFSERGTLIAIGMGCLLLWVKSRF